jgi:RmlD substrate binding domain
VRANVRVIVLRDRQRTSAERASMMRLLDELLA